MCQAGFMRAVIPREVLIFPRRDVLDAAMVLSRVAGASWICCFRSIVRQCVCSLGGDAMITEAHIGDSLMGNALKHLT